MWPALSGFLCMIGYFLLSIALVLVVFPHALHDTVFFTT